jgi:hypothetical protein
VIARPHARTDRGARRRRRATLAALTVLASGSGTLALAPSTAHAADEKLACVRAGEKAQKLRDSGKLIAARVELLTCVREVCPAVVRGDCAGWLGEVETSTPTIVARARDEGGHDLRDVVVSVDGARVASQLDGRPLPVDPGEHVVRFELAGRAPLEEHVIIGTGEKNRMLAVTFARIASAVSARETVAPLKNARSEAEIRPPPESPVASRAASSGPSAAAWAFAAVSVAAAASFTVFGLTGTHDLDQLRSTCAGHCDGAAVDRAWTKLVVADVSLGVAVVAAGVATWLFLSPWSSSSRSGGAASARTSHAAFVPSSHGASLAWIGAF